MDANADDIDMEVGDPAGSSGSQTVRKNISLKLKTRTGKGRGKKAARGRKASPRKPAKAEQGDEKMEHDGDGLEEELEVPQARECVLPAMKPITGVLEPRHRQRNLRWNHKVRLIGEKVVDPTIHCCEKCSLPILIYGRMIPCKHVFCLDCAKRTTSSAEKNCPRCEDQVQRIEQAALGTVFVCAHGGAKHGVSGCRRTYLSQRDLQAHHAHRHEQKPPKTAEPQRQPAQPIEEYKTAGGPVSSVSSVTPVLEMLQQSVRGPPPPQVPQAQPVSVPLTPSAHGQPMYRPPNTDSARLQGPPPGQHLQAPPSMPPPRHPTPQPRLPQPGHPPLQNLPPPQGPAQPTGQPVLQQHMQPAPGGQIESYHTIPVMAPRTNLITVPLQEERPDFRRDRKPVAYVSPQGPGHQAAMGFHPQQTPPGAPPPGTQHYPSVSQAPPNTAGPPVSFSHAALSHPPPGYNMSGPPPRGPHNQGPPPTQNPQIQGNVPVSHNAMSGALQMPNTGTRPPITQPPPMNSMSPMGHPGAPLSRPVGPLSHGAPMGRPGAPMSRPGAPMPQVGGPPPQGPPPQTQYPGARPRFENQTGTPPFSQPGGHAQRGPWPTSAPGGPPGPRPHGPPGPSGPPPRGPPPVRPPNSQGTMGPPPPRPYYQ